MDDLVPLAPFIMTVLIVLTVFFFSSRNRREVLETMREAIRNGQTLDPETIKALGMPQKKAGNGDLKWGLILIAVALALIVMGWMIASTTTMAAGEPDPLIMMTGIAAFPGFIGLVLTGFGVVRARRQGKIDGEG
ncbi:hypothetical protein F1654_03790 [Alkalicaulis satelles]|uniref:DUF6249 domain-containing protein n=1 Tax=Alkalicaulis satelles TaxID=2609175 RepID=A0A5M6ZJY8_9PROT|nr:DUF6249 domain-containing protein [Alkalicaulis satelles]KAA5805119.1 hypothetical protein F1654_03790 [Alkalicaulis satelles]